MKFGNFKAKNQQKPVEYHETAAWANKEKCKNISNVNIPDETQVFNAKDYVDENEK